MTDRDRREDDATLVARVRAGERAAFDGLVVRYYGRVTRLAQRLLGPTPEAQDVAQEAVLLAFLELRQLRAPARFGAWLHGIAANLARHALRRRRLLSLDALHAAAPQAAWWADGRPGPEDRQLARASHATIVAALQELSEVNRAVVIGCYLDGHSYADLAALLGVPVSTVKGRLFKGRRHLRRMLAATADEVLPRAPGQPARPAKEPAMETPRLVEVTIAGVHRHPAKADHRLVLLRPAAADQVLPIWIGPCEADAITRALEGQPPARPMTHDLTIRLLQALGGQVARVVVNQLVNDTYYAAITVTQGGQHQTVDARPSDALALAVRTGAPLYLAQAVLEATPTYPAGTDLAPVWEQMPARQPARGAAAGPPGAEPPPASATP